MKVTIQRSREWCKARALERGEDVPQQLTVAIEPRDLSPEARAILLKLCWDATYPTRVSALWYNPQYLLSAYASYGKEEFVLDGDEPTNADLDHAIREAYRRVCEKAGRFRRQQAERDERKRREQAEDEAREEQRRNARKVLADELDKLNRDRKYAVQQTVRMNLDRQVIQEFYKCLTDDAVQDALDAMQQNRSPETEAIRGRIEAAIYGQSDEGQGDA